VDERLARERDFHNEAFFDERRQAVGRWYTVAGASLVYYRTILERLCPRGRVLEYGCGLGSFSHYMAQRGAIVSGIDLSDGAIRAAARGVQPNEKGRLHFAVMNAEALGFSPGTFDLICGAAILHHLDLRGAFRQVASALKPGGTGVFLEPLGHNPVINLYRRLTPRMRTVDEHPLKINDLALAHEFFDDVQLRFFSLATLVAAPLCGTRYFKKFLTQCEALDRRVLGNSLIGRYAWQAVLVVTKPRTRLASAAG
jgi:SAM-dependent methyltransferase